jgi:imidazolonepropionase-like amidohydrolase
VRDPGTPDQGSFYLELRQGRPEWPRFFSSGPVIDGPPGVHWSGTRVVATAEQASHEVESIAAAGAELIKTYFWLRPEPLATVVAAAHDHGLPVAYHPGMVSVAQAIEMGVDQVEHVLHAPDLLPPEEIGRASSLPDRAWDSLEMLRLWRYVEPTGAPAANLLERMADSGTVLTPTLTLSAAVLHGPSGTHADAGRKSEMPAEVLRRWEETGHPEQYADGDLAEAPRILDRQLEHIRIARDAGVRVAAGTGGMGHFLVPGASLLDELELLVRAGLSPVEALVAGTRTAAELVGQGGALGTLSVGARADLVVLGADPLVDISNVRSQIAVLKEGKVVAGSLA